MTTTLRGGLEKGLATAIGTVLKGLQKAMTDRITLLEQRIATLESRPQFQYRGTWQPDTSYSIGDFVTAAGSLWTAKLNHLQSRPTEDHVNWQLVCKRGRDGRDTR